MGQAGGLAEEARQACDGGSYEMLVSLGISLSPEQAPSPASPAQEELNQRQTPEQQQEEATMIPPEPGTGIPASTSPLSLKQEEESAEGGELPPSPSTDSLLSVEPGKSSPARAQL